MSRSDASSANNSLTGHHAPAMIPVMHTRRGFLLLVLASLLVALVPAAYASPPDPTWIAGYWDDGDFDNAVMVIVSACATTVVPITSASPLLTPVPSVETSEWTACPT